MTAIPSRTCCVSCGGKERATVRCGGCLQDFCFNHLLVHQNELNQQLNEIETDRDQFREILTEQTKDSKKHILMQQIDQWENDSIAKIRQIANETREICLRHTTAHISQIESRLNSLTNRLREKREENDYFETDLDQWKEELFQITEQLTKPMDITLRQNSIAIVTKIYIDIPSVESVPSCSRQVDTTCRRWVQNGITIAGGNEKGDGFNQLDRPYSIYVDDDDDDQTIFIADCNNHRIMKWKNGDKIGQIIVGGNNQLDQLNSPMNVIVDKRRDCLLICDVRNKRIMQWSRQKRINVQVTISNINCYSLALNDEGYLYFADHINHAVKRWRMNDSTGEIVAGGNGEGDRLDQLHHPTYIFVDKEHSIYVSDQSNHRVMKWSKNAKEGIVVAGVQGQGDSLTQLSNPNAIFVDELGTIFVADSSNNRIICWTKGASEARVVVGGNGIGGNSNQLRYPMGLSFDRSGNLYVSDTNNHRVQKFHVDSTLNF